MASESIAAYTKEENGKVIPMWTKEQVDELVAAQVFIPSSWIILDSNSFSVNRPLYSC